MDVRREVVAVPRLALCRDLLLEQPCRSLVLDQQGAHRTWHGYAQPVAPSTQVAGPVDCPSALARAVAAVHEQQRAPRQVDLATLPKQRLGVRVATGGEVAEGRESVGDLILGRASVHVRAECLAGDLLGQLLVAAYGAHAADFPRFVGASIG